MKQVILSVIFMLVFHVPVYSQSYEMPDSVKRVVFIGNSITYGGKYIEYIETYLSIRHPEKELKIINVGLPSETVSGLSEPNHAGGAFPRPDLHERLARVLTSTKPDLVISCYGMNDGIYLPFDEGRFEKFKEGINWLNTQTENYGAEIIHVTPPIFDERKGKAYANVLDIYSDWLISNRYTSGWNVIDIHWPMRKELEEQRRLDSTFVFANDGIHPNEKGHLIMAKHILLYFGETEFAKINDVKGLLAANQNGEEILNCVGKRQKMMKDAWLTSIGHQRPRMAIGLPIAEAEQKSDEIAAEIRALLKRD